MRLALVALLLLGAAVLPASEAAAATTPQASVVVRAVDGQLHWFRRHPVGASAATEEFTFGRAGDRPLWGDWDGDGMFTVGVVRGTTWYLRNGAGGGPHDIEFAYGRVGDHFLAGDWDGNGTFTPGTVRGTTWYLRNGAGGGPHDIAPFGYGQPGDQFVAGDWDGDGTWTPGIRRANTWHLRNAHAGGTADNQFAFGAASGDTPMYSGAAPRSPTATPIDWSRFTLPAPADPDAARLVAILRNTNRYAMLTWWSSKGYATQTGAYLNFGGVGESEIRAPANEAFALAVSLRLGAYDEAIAGVPAAEARARAVKLARSLALRHLANTGTGGWGDHWQSAMWSAFAGYAAWLLWEYLSAADREYVARMVEREADRFIRYPVPYYQDRTGVIAYLGDSKAEENSWNAMILQVATAMLPAHPRRASWLRKSVELEISSFSRPADLTNTTVLNGRQVRSWLGGSNINNDGVVINHGFAHPDYSTTVNANIFAALAHSMAGQPTERAAFFGADRVYDALVDKQWVAGSTYPPRGAVLPPGGTVYVRGSEHLYYPQGNDWGTDRRIQPMLLDVQARAFGFDSLASVKGDVWQRLHGDRVLDMQSRSADRRTYIGAAEDRYYGREELVAVTVAQAWATRWIVAQGAFVISDAPY
jgi:hypothetical protein